MLSACGLLCDKCGYLGKNCGGCSEVKGKPFWIKEMQMENCGLYQCCINEKDLPHCGHCQILPCDMFRQYKDPRMSDEEHDQNMKARIERLRSEI